jgi:putative ABC transport system permease protein
MFLLTFVLAVAAALLAGVFPALRASRVPPALQLKTL